jgi:hypothetical protein
MSTLRQGSPQNIGRRESITFRTVSVVIAAAVTPRETDVGGHVKEMATDPVLSGSGVRPEG